METKNIIEIAKEWKEGKKYVAVDDMIKEIEDRIEGFKKYRKGINKNPQLVTACDCFLSHLDELKKHLQPTHKKKLSKGVNEFKVKNTV